MYVWFIPRIASIDGAMTVPSAWLGVSNMALIIVSVMVLSELSYRLFEDPVRRLLNGRGWSLPSPLNHRISP